VHLLTGQEHLRALLAPAGTHPERHRITTCPTTFCHHAAACTAPELHRLATTVDKWWLTVLAGLETEYSSRGRKTTGGSPSTKDATASGSSIPSTSDDAYSGPASVSTDGSASRRGIAAHRCPIRLGGPGIWYGRPRDEK
jgi:hypothetical protein